MITLKMTVGEVLVCIVDASRFRGTEVKTGTLYYVPERDKGPDSPCFLLQVGVKDSVQPKGKEGHP